MEEMESKEIKTEELKSVVSLSKEDLVKEYDTLYKSYSDTLNKINDLTQAKFKLEGALINLQELLKKFNPEKTE
jgi:hypothetical protein